MSFDIFKEMEKYGAEQVIFNYDKTSGLKAIVSIHNSTLGPAAGGCRMMEYEKVEDAIMDAIRLSKGMSYKSSVAGTNFGGGKSVIIGDPKTDKNEMLFRAFGRFLETLNGRYYSGTDVGTEIEDFEYAKQESSYFLGQPKIPGGGGGTAVPTAYGVYIGMKACAKKVFGDDSLKGLTIAIQGMGKIGKLLIEHLLKEEAELIVTAKSEETINWVAKNYPSVKLVQADDIYGQECDIFAPCALGGILNDETIPKLNCKIIAGGANNQLAEERHGDILHEKGLLYAPDFVINSGGSVQVEDTFLNGDVNVDRVLNKTKNIYNTLMTIFEISEEKDIPTYEAADHFAEERIEAVAQIKRNYIKR